MRISTLRITVFILAMFIIAPTVSMAIVSAEEIKKDEAENLEGLDPKAKDKAADELAKKEGDAREQFSGFGMAAALFTNIDLGDHDIVDTAILAGDPKVVRLQKDSNVQPGIGLEAHYFLLPNFRLFGFSELGKGKWGVGPYVGLTLGSDTIIDTISFGGMLGMRRDAFFSILTNGTVQGEPAGDSFNLSLGAFVDPDAQVLGAGIKPNRPLPNGEDQIRFRTTSQVGLQLGFSYYFSIPNLIGG